MSRNTSKFNRLLARKQAAARHDFELCAYTGETAGPVRHRRKPLAKRV